MTMQINNEEPDVQLDMLCNNVATLDADEIVPSMYAAFVVVYQSS